MRHFFLAVLSCNDCPFKVKRSEKDLDNPEISTTDHMVNIHLLHTGHKKYSLDVEEVMELEVETGGEVLNVDWNL